MTRTATLSLICLLLLPAGDALAGPAHEALDGILRAHVKSGKVDYKAIKKSKLGDLDTYLKAVASADLAGLKRNEKLAFYLNAYNALVIRAVIRKLPLKSVMKAKGFFDKERHKVAGRSLTLNGLENKIIRPRFKDARIHFALVCAAKSCPPLMPRAFASATLNKDLNRLTRRFLKSRHGLVISGDKVQVSQLFKWYQKDFDESAGSVGKYLAKYRKVDAALLSRDGLKIDYLNYDWALNGK